MKNKFLLTALLSTVLITTAAEAKIDNTKPTKFGTTTYDCTVDVVVQKINGEGGQSYSVDVFANPTVLGDRGIYDTLQVSANNGLQAAKNLVLDFVKNRACADGQDAGGEHFSAVCKKGALVKQQAYHNTLQENPVYPRAEVISCNNTNLIPIINY